MDATNSREDASRRDHPDDYRDGRISFAPGSLNDPTRDEARVRRGQSSIPERDPPRTRWRSCRRDFAGREERACRLECRKRGVYPLP